MRLNKTMHYQISRQGRLDYPDADETIFSFLDEMQIID